jgi:hypothetical protein
VLMGGPSQHADRVFLGDADEPDLDRHFPNACNAEKPFVARIFDAPPRSAAEPPVVPGESKKRVGVEE